MNRDKKQGAAPSENYIKYILEHGPVNRSLSAKIGNLHWRLKWGRFEGATLPLSPKKSF